MRFVSFERVSNGTRIGSMTITADGEYELRLRKSMRFSRYTGPDREYIIGTERGIHGMRT